MIGEKYNAVTHRFTYLLTFVKVIILILLYYHFNACLTVYVSNYIRENNPDEKTILSIDNLHDCEWWE